MIQRGPTSQIFGKIENPTFDLDVIIYDSFRLTIEQGKVGFIEGKNNDAKPFDPVAIFTDSKAVPGDKTITATKGGITYWFANQDNARLFNSNPQKFEPNYGGWCARAMAVGQKVVINPSIFTVVGNRSFFFVNQRAKRYFDSMLDVNIEKADQEWEKISGEKPRI